MKLNLIGGKHSFQHIECKMQLILGSNMNYHWDRPNHGTAWVCFHEIFAVKEQRNHKLSMFSYTLGETSDML